MILLYSRWFKKDLKKAFPEFNYVNIKLFSEIDTGPINGKYGIDHSTEYLKSHIYKRKRE